MGLLQSILKGESGWVRDAAGVRRQVYDPAEQMHPGDDQRYLTRSEFNVIREEAFRRSGTRKWVRPALALIGAYMLIVGVIGLRNGLNKDTAAGLAAGILGAVVFCYFAFIHLPATPLQVVQIMIGRGRCASCGHVLEPSEAANEHRCTECGGLWRLTAPLSSSRPPLAPPPCTSPKPFRDPPH